MFRNPTLRRSDPRPARAATTLLALALFAGLALPLQAATPIDETRPLDPRGRVEIDNVKGSIDVRAWDRSEVRITGSLGEGVEKLEITGDRQYLSVKVKYPNRGSGLGFFTGSDRSEPTDLVLMVPLRADLDIDSVSASVKVAGVAPAELSIDSVSGDVDVAGAPDEIDVDSVSGDLRLVVNSRNVDVETVSGEIELRGRLSDEVSIETVSGDAQVQVVESALRRFSGASVSGDLSLRTALAGNGRIDLETVSGDVDLYLPRGLSAGVRGETFSGSLRAPGADIQRPRHGPGASFEHRYGSGEGEVSIETFSGDATLHMD
ncbi:DUF4097 family beta strand repeat-containing protein [Marilutibacter chinensis]|uniref:DUF4097 domain-containing protein n=1 Tax=Marilutibacter chinensis TaxID=2912247 RepID=A0ABS9HTZ2_9GAMM|nr:DUF4097 family beta strand repeat-containing protein [Lysobacter chinensis]MCF7221981.1 DUF4097 domain-containing protein [Lysobacter chinensis]